MAQIMGTETAMLQPWNKSGTKGIKVHAPCCVEYLLRSEISFRTRKIVLWLCTSADKNRHCYIQKKKPKLLNITVRTQKLPMLFATTTFLGWWKPPLFKHLNAYLIYLSCLIGTWNAVLFGKIHISKYENWIW